MTIATSYEVRYAQAIPIEYMMNRFEEILNNLQAIADRVPTPTTTSFPNHGSRAGADSTYAILQLKDISPPVRIGIYGRKSLAQESDGKITIDVHHSQPRQTCLADLERIIQPLGFGLLWSKKEEDVGDYLDNTPINRPHPITALS